MTKLENLKKNWEKKQRTVGALRLQSSDGDCVPTTVINALLYLTGKRISPKLQRLIWSVALDHEGETTGSVGCQLMSDVVNAWRVHAEKPDEKTPFNFHSCIAQEKDRLLDGVQNVIKNGGVACLTCKKGKHYALLHSFDGEIFYGFDPYLPNGKEPQDGFFKHIEIVEATSPDTEHKKVSGMVNFSISIPKLKDLLGVEPNKWVHLIEVSQNFKSTSA